MAASITPFRSRADLLHHDEALRLRQALLDQAGGLPAAAVGALIAAIDKQTVSGSGWTFVMISPDQNRSVVAWLESNSRRPLKALRLWAEVFTELRRDTGQIMMRREQLAERVGIEPRDVSRIMGELSRCGAIIRHRDDAGRAEYFVNPRVGTCLAGAARDQAQADAPKILTSLESGRE